MADAKEFGLLARLLHYPEEGYSEEARECRDFFTAKDPEVGVLLEDFVERVRSLSLEELQALYTSTFDLTPLCSLEVGWHLFGENYERGEFLVKMRGELRRYGVTESTELPDHLTHALELLACMQVDEAASFATACLIPAMDKMRGEMMGKSNPFESVLLALDHLLTRRFPQPQSEMIPTEAVFHILDGGSGR